jgi:hypothetical protein
VEDWSCHASFGLSVWKLDIDIVGLPRKAQSRLRFAPAAATSPAAFAEGGVSRGAGKTMRAEIERLVEEIKQSVGLLRRHL